MHRVQIVSPAYPIDVEFVISNLRDQDVAEAMSFGLDPVHGPQLMFQLATTSYVAMLDGVPAFIFGTIEAPKGVHQLWGFGTGRAWRTIPYLTRFCHTEGLKQLAALGMRRLQVHVPETSVHSLKWLEGTGLIRECSMNAYCADGSAMVQLAATREELEHHVLQTTLHARATAADAAAALHTASPGDSSSSASV